MTDVLLIEDDGAQQHRRKSAASVIRFLGLLIGADSLPISDTGGRLDLSGADVKIATSANTDAPATNAALTAAASTASGLVTSEATARASADTTLQTNINNEATSRANADTTLQANITSEATSRASADTTLQGNITTEASSRTTADTTLQANITAEAGTRATADTSLQTQITANGNAITAIQAIDTSLQSQVTANANSITTLNTEMAADQAAIAAIQAAVPLEQTFTGDGSTVAFTATLFAWDSHNTVLDIQVRVDGRIESVDQTGSGLKGYQKTSTTVLTLTEAPKTGSEIVIRKLGTSAGLDIQNLNVPPSPATAGGQALGTLAKPFSGLYLKDTVTSQVYLLQVISGVFGVSLVP